MFPGMRSAQGACLGRELCRIFLVRDDDPPPPLFTSLPTKHGLRHGFAKRAICRLFPARTSATRVQTVHGIACPTR